MPLYHTQNYEFYYICWENKHVFRDHFFFLIGHLYMGGMWLVVHVRIDTKKTCLQEKNWHVCFKIC